MSNAEIAGRSGVSRDAVKFHLANVRGKLGLMNRAAVAGLAAIPSDSALAGQDLMTETITLGPIGQISRTVGNIEAAVAWYRDVLGLPHLYTFGDLAFFDCGGTRLYLQAREKPSADESVLYFQVPDIRAAHAQLAERGVVFSHPPHMIHRHADGTEEWMAFFTDPDGRPLAIIAQARPAG